MLRSDNSEVNDDNGDDIPRVENVIDDRQEIREARRLDGFHDIDPQHKVQVTVSAFDTSTAHKH